jgi:nanoRNase/pAp phosphatase (c-di-AMP/oligoRNAs hydrolase)
LNEKVRETVPFAEATRLFVEAIQNVKGDEVVGWAHDRMDPDTMGAAGLSWYILKEKFDKKFVCYYSKAMSFLMNRSLAKNFLPSRLLLRCEEEKDLLGIATRAPLIVILDATSPETMTDLSRLMRRSDEVRQKPIFFIDHHRRGSVDVEDLPNAHGLRLEDAQATSAIMVHVLRNLGLDLNPKSEECFRIAVAAKAGIETDLIGVDRDGLADTTRDALAYLDSVIGERGEEILDKLRGLKQPLSWYKRLGDALARVNDYDQKIAVVGLGVIDDTGMIPFVANELMATGPFKTAIVFGLVYDRIEDRIVAVDLDASGRSSQDTEVVLPDLFHEIFYITDEEGRKISKGGGRSNMLLGDYSGAGASVPLRYWRDLPTASADDKVSLLERYAWPAEFLRLRHLIAQRVALKPEKILSVVPVDAVYAKKVANGHHGPTDGAA